MKKRLKEDLRKLSTKIITTEDLSDIGDLYEASKELYEKLAVLKFIEEELNEMQVDVSKNVIAAKFEEMANAVMRENTGVPENNPHEEDIITPGMDTIKSMVSEMPSAEQVDQIFGEFMAKPDLMKNVIAAKFEEMANAVMKENAAVPENNPHDEDIITPGMDTIKDMISEMPTSEEVDQIFGEFIAKPELMKNEKEILMPEAKSNQNGFTATASINDKLSKDIKVDLNDRLAFVKHLFNDSMEDFNRVLSQLNSIDTEERSISFILNMVKPDYNQWEGKEEYETRFMKLIERRFL